ncbi:hypothetical protein SLE2022_013150 [Rubroshorea leprosula]
MGSLTATVPSPSREFNPSGYRVYASFCPKETDVSNRLECYDPPNNSWSHVCPIPGIIEDHVLKDFSMASLRQSVYIIGDRLCDEQMLCNSDTSDDFIDSSVQALPLVLRYDVRLGQWAKCAPMGVPTAL